MSTLLTEQIKFNLESEGLAKHLDDIRYRLSYSQGDGVAFYGSIPVSLGGYSDSFLDRLVHNNIDYLFEIKNYAHKHQIISFDELNDYIVDIKVSKSRDFHMYNHYNTMIIRPENIEFYDVQYLIEEVIDHIAMRDDWQLGVAEIFGDEPGMVEEICEEIDENIEYYVDDDAPQPYRVIRYDAIFNEINNYYLGVDNITYPERIAAGVKENLVSLSKKIEKDCYNYIEENEEIFA